MNRKPLSILLAAAALMNIGFASASEPTMAEMQWHRRVIVVATANRDDPQFLAQERALSTWSGGGDRDVSVVRIVGDSVSGSRETATQLRTRYHFDAKTFAVALIGKDGHLALRSMTALSGVQFQTAIDAMPMRKAGQR